MRCFCVLASAVFLLAGGCGEGWEDVGESSVGVSTQALKTPCQTASVAAADAGKDYTKAAAAVGKKCKSDLNAADCVAAKAECDLSFNALNTRNTQMRNACQGLPEDPGGGF